MALALLVGLLIAGSFALGQLFARPQWQEARNAAAPIVVAAAVERRTVDDRPEFPGVVRGPDTAGVTLEVAPPAVVTKPPPGPGSRVATGELIAEISGRPYFALSPPLALYRDLRDGDRGEDVRSLQRSLNQAGYAVAETGQVGSVTIIRVRALFRAAGYPLPTEPLPAEREAAGAGTPMPRTRPIIPANQLVATSGGVVASSLGLGARLTSDQPVVVFETSASSVAITLPASAAATVRPGDEVEIRGPDTLGRGRVVTVGRFEAAAEGRMPGHPVRIEAADGTVLPEGASVLVRAGGETPEPGSAVPITALRSDGTTTYVLVERSAPESPRRVTVIVLRRAHGWAAVEGVAPGQRVRIT